jgi:hypothetical protein
MYEQIEKALLFLTEGSAAYRNTNSLTKQGIDLLHP